MTWNEFQQLVANTKADPEADVELMVRGLATLPAPANVVALQVVGAAIRIEARGDRVIVHGED